MARVPEAGCLPSEGDARVTRRDVLCAGLAGALGAALPARGPHPAAPGPRERALVIIWADGGPSQLDTFDPKPGAPREVRGPFGAIRSSIPGVQVVEHLPRLAARLHRCTLVRGLCHGEAAHDRARRQLLPARAATVGHIAPPPGASTRNEPPARVLDHYGRHLFGRQCAAALRLVEGGARRVLIRQPGWDTHSGGGRTLERWLLPALDRALSALIDDLDAAGLLERTVVMWVGEFGRTPRLNALGGRDHWPHAGCALLAGGGLPRGAVIGATDATGMEVVSDPMHPAGLLRLAGAAPADVARGAGMAAGQHEPMRGPRT